MKKKKTEKNFGNGKKRRKWGIKFFFFFLFVFISSFLSFPCFLTTLGSIFSSLPEYPQLVLTKEFYEEVGPYSVQSKFFGLIEPKKETKGGKSEIPKKRK